MATGSDGELREVLSDDASRPPPLNPTAPSHTVVGRGADRLDGKGALGGRRLTNHPGMGMGYRDSTIDGLGSPPSPVRQSVLNAGVVPGGSFGPPRESGANREQTTFVQKEGLRKFSGKKEESVAEWEADARRYLRRVGQRGNGVDLILDSLGGQARREILSTPEGADNVEEIFELLREVYGDSRGAAELHALFVGRRQRPGETVTEYSTALKDLFFQLQGKQLGLLAVRNQMLTDQFIEGVRDRAAQPMLRKQASEFRGQTFERFRREALAWLKDGPEPIARVREIEQNEQPRAMACGLCGGSGHPTNRCANRTPGPNIGSGNGWPRGSNRQARPGQ
jgi:hypothetical protein